MKKISLFLLIAIFSLIMVDSVSAQEGTVIKVSKEIAKCGEMVSVSVEIQGNTGFKAYGMTLGYDSAVLELSSITAGEKSATGFFNGNTNTSIIGYANNATVEGDGVLFTVTFKVLTNVAGEYPVHIELDAIGISSQDKMAATVVNGSVTVEHVHDFGEWTVTKAPSCTEKGEERQICSECGKYEARDIAATGHSYGDWVVTKEATKTEKGEKQRTCANCDSVESEEIPMLEDIPGVGDNNRVRVWLVILFACMLSISVVGFKKKTTR